MANYNAHTYFGMKVLHALPPEARRRCAGDLPVFRLGLYGPDPLIFLLKTKWISDHLHRNWREATLPDLERVLRRGSPATASFAAGYLLHMFLDDTVHPMIYQWMEEGSSHFRLEVALDAIVLREQGLEQSPRLAVLGRQRCAEVAEGFLHPAEGSDYLSGLWRMAAVTEHFRHRGDRADRRVTETEKGQAALLRERMEEAILPAAGMLGEILGVRPAALYRDEGARRRYSANHQTIH